MAKDKDYIKMIQSRRWSTLRRQVLSEHPTCARCDEEGRLRLAVEVHHVVPVESGLTITEKSRLMFNRSNLTPLCHACHVITHTEMGRSGREATRRKNNILVCKVIHKFYNCKQEEGGDGFLEGGGVP